MLSFEDKTNLNKYFKSFNFMKIRKLFFNCMIDGNSAFMGNKMKVIFIGTGFAIIIVWYVLSDQRSINGKSNIFEMKNTSKDVMYSEDLKKRLQDRQRILDYLDNYHLENIKNAKQHLPKVIIIGARKCGTGGLVKFLEHHKLINLPYLAVETNFFKTKFSNGMDYYRKLFPPLNDKEIAIEKTPGYFGCNNASSKRIKENLPGVKILLIVCNPTARAFSDYIHQILEFKNLKNYKDFDQFLDNYLPRVKNMLTSYENQSIDKTIQALMEFCKTDTSATIISLGLYYYHIQEWIKLFNKSNFMIIDGEKFIQDPGTIIEMIQEFIGIPKLLWREDFAKASNGFFCYRQFKTQHLSKNFKNQKNTLQCLPKGKGRSRNGIRTMSKDAINKLNNFYASYNNKFIKLVNYKFNWTT